MATHRQLALIKKQLGQLLDTLFRTGQLHKPELNDIRQLLQDPDLIPFLTEGLYGSTQEALIPAMPIKVVRLAIREISKKQEASVLLFQRTDVPTPSSTGSSAFTCVVGHRFTKHIEDTFRWNLQELYSRLGITALYSGVDFRTVGILEDLVHKIT